MSISAFFLPRFFSLFSLTISLFLLPVFLFLSPVHSETLTDALSSSYVSNPVLNAARASNRAISERLEDAYSGYRPNITFRGDYNFQDFTTTPYILSDTSTIRNDSLKPYGYGIHLSQNLFNGFRTAHNIRSARSLISSDSENLRLSEQDILFLTVRAYIGVLQAQDLVEIRRKNMAFLEEQTRSGLARLEVGEATRTDVSQSDAQLALARAQESAAVANLSAMRGQYRLIVGSDPESLIWPEPLSLSDPFLYPSTLESAIDLSLTDHPLIQSAIHRLSSAKSDESSFKGALFPQLDLRASTTERYNSSSFRNQRDTSLVLDLSIPLYQGGQAGAVIRGQRSVVAQRQLDIDHVRLQLRSLVISVWSGLESAKANYAANLEQLSAAKLALDGVIQEHDVGQRTQLDILDAQSAVLRAEELVLSSRSSRVIQSYELLSSIGGLSASRLSLPVTLQPAVSTKASLLGIKLSK